MSVKYVPVIWNRNKMLYDAVLIIAVAVYVTLYIRVVPEFWDVTRPPDGAIVRMQAFGTCAFLMLTVILCIGPLARIDRRFLPLLYNRRHFGVLTCAVAFVHATYVMNWYYNFTPSEPYAALLSSNTSFGQVVGFPFEAFGIFALAILLVLAVTSHDFWLSFLTPPVWKTLHMGVYFAYAAIVLHVALGYLQSVENPAFAVVVAASVTAVSGLHFVAGRQEAHADTSAEGEAPEWIEAGEVADIADKRAIVVTIPGGERVAIFRDGDNLSAVTNVCVHQNGPLGEGRVIDGCVTCPWHGYQYRLADGCAPAPFTEKIATYELKLNGDQVLLNPRAKPPGTYVEPVNLGRAGSI